MPAPPVASRGAAVPSVDDVRRNVRAPMATGGFNGLTFPAIDLEALRRHQRRAVARAGTPAPPEQAPLDEQAGELRRRGSNFVGAVPTGEQHGFICSSDKAGRVLSLSRGSEPKEQMAAWPPPGKKDTGRSFTGVTVDGVAGTCGASARPRP
ncbi:hypothetical protein HB370_40265 [Streptomyces sp. DSM 40868]|nr:hypothetical protein [Streptomyces sp. DSM 40868]QIS75414.1 hypothetical protein HB370_40265 [Streptomyces sp. DSM 40868]